MIADDVIARLETSLDQEIAILREAMRSDSVNEIYQTIEYLGDVIHEAPCWIQQRNARLMLIGFMSVSLALLRMDRDESDWTDERPLP
jgi:hypothetical protein